MIARFDGSVADAKIAKTVAASTAYKVIVEAYLPTGSDYADFVECDTNADGLYNDPANFGSDLGGVAGAVPRDAWMTLELDLSHVASNNWNIAFKANGAALFTDSGVVFSHDATAPMLFEIGSIFSSFVPGNIRYVRRVEIRNAANTLLFSDDFSSNNFSAWGSVAGAAAVLPDVAVRRIYTLELCDLATDTLLADLTGAATFTVKPRRSGIPTEIDISIAGDNAAIRDTSFDGTRNLIKGIRTLKVRKRGALIEHGIVWDVDYDADANGTVCAAIAHGPLKTVQGRPYRDATGNLIDPDITSPISGAEIVKGGIDNTVSNSGSPGDQEGYLPIDTSAGVFDTTIPPAADLGVELTDWPIMLDDVVTLIRQTGAVDIWTDPVDTAMGYPAGIIGVLNVANRRGSDVSSSVHFDWDVGSRNAARFRRHDSMDKVVNKLVYYLGPKRTKERWAGNITATETTPEDLSAYLALEVASRAKYWTILRNRIIDDNANDNANRKLYHVDWKQEVLSSVDGQEVVHVTPVALGTFEPYDDYMPGDSVGLSCSDRCGPALSSVVQRLDGFDVTVGVDGVGVVSELQTQQDA